VGLHDTLKVNLAVDTYLYKASLVQAAPGKLLDLIDTYKKIFAEETKVAGDATPLWMRHSQGDRWDLLVLFPMGSYMEYYTPDRVVKRDTVLDDWRERLKTDIADSQHFVNDQDIGL